MCVNGWIRGFGVVPLVFLHTDCDECSELWTPGLYCHWISLKPVSDNSIKINFGKLPYRILLITSLEDIDFRPAISELHYIGACLLNEAD